MPGGGPAMAIVSHSKTRLHRANEKFTLLL
jgi:hypothetical protein